MRSPLFQDIRFGIRMLGRQPGVTVVAVLILAVAIGANNTIFTMVNAVVLRPLAGVPGSDELVMLVEQTKAGDDIPVSFRDYEDYRDRNDVLAGLMGVVINPFSAKVDETAERIWGEYVSGNYFQVLGVRPVLGRVLGPEDDLVPGGHPVAVISHGLWQRRFGGDRDIIGRTIELDSTTFTIVGVAQESFQGSVVALRLDIYVPVMMEAAGRTSDAAAIFENRTRHNMIVLGRLRQGVSFEQADAAVQTVASGIRADFPDVNEGMTARLYPLWRAPFGGQSFLVPVVTILSVSVLLVLLIACSNVANLLLARASARKSEVAVRLSLGAGRSRLVRQFLTESVLLALLAGVVGMVFARWLSVVLQSLRPQSFLPTSLPATQDPAVLVFTTVLTLLAAILFGITPALRGTKVDLVSTLKGAGSTRGPVRSRLRGTLLTVQVAFSLVGLIAAGLILESVHQSRRIDPGFDADNVLLLTMDVSPAGYGLEEGREFYRTLMGEVGRLPGVVSVTASAWLPLGIPNHPATGIAVDGYVPQPDEMMAVNYNVVGPDYFDSMRTSIARGRDFAFQDDQDGRAVVIINEKMANRFWTDRDALGGRIMVGDKWREVVGVARDSKYMSLSEEPTPYLFLPLLQESRNTMNLQIRTQGDPFEWRRAVEGEVHRLNAGVPIFSVKVLTDQIDEDVSQFRMAATMLTVLGLQGLAMALAGLVGLMAYSVQRRTQEIGIRLALGARPVQILRWAVTQGMRWVFLGVGVGLVASLALGRVLSGLLYGVSATDPLILLSVSLLLLLVSLAAAWIPARRAARVDPMVALRYE